MVRVKNWSFAYLLQIVLFIFFLLQDLRPQSEEKHKEKKTATEFVSFSGDQKQTKSTPD